jgi:hypothetical protein
MSAKNKSMRWHVTDGRDRIGIVELKLGKFVSINNDGEVIKKSDTLHEAMGAEFTTARRRKLAHKTTKGEV